jgi:hypothetical protein
MNTRACPQCRSANLASAVLCVNCGARLADPPHVPAQIPPPATAPGPSVAGRPAPPMPTGASPQYGGVPSALPPPRRRSILVPILGLVAAAVIAVGVLSILNRDGGSLPGEIDGLERINTADASSFEDTMAAQKYGEIRMEGGMYGDGGRPVLVVGLVRNLPQSQLQAPLEFVFDQAAGGFAGTSGGAIDSSGAVSATVAGVDYRCASFEVPVPVSGGSGHGSICMWLADDLGFVITFRNPDPSAAFADVRATYEAIRGS